ncbi:ankyrin repeat protein, putative [Trichomonas vaginalis G3]|uniref:Ankyrin repeat protein, putative n=1 Tax=Trichomonas vaginalis (strain ATCC PRA-98 / G3) TaxID=412133 RepID=A2DQJ8_TRIV3|nr:ankyrin repeat and SOCS box-containing protein 4 family [Trichomonas vaginalis G3]EAY17282.1 ankyrin repeat protein, putative [Trichomonas vaginalis G3]KAI5523274.1 ankyrin repeat and SOCS box-containing protein 4 family [Trichomonas vaginalis G3]|eukprot:XP_001329505.1 ankyrin repeat protein [Trichomonas vaginalis G3]
MYDQVTDSNKYNELRSICKYYIDSYKALYQLKTNNEEEIKSIYNMIKTELIETNKQLPRNVMNNILHIITFNNRCTKSYLALAKQISDDYHIKEAGNIPLTSSYLFYKEYGINFDMADDYKLLKSEKLEILSEDTIYRAIMNNDKDRFIFFTESEEFDKNQKLESYLYPYSKDGYSLLKLCCYYGAVDCFKLIRTKFNSEITTNCLELSFLGGNPEIISECLKYEVPDEGCIARANISHNIDFITFLMNEFEEDIDLEYCVMHKDLESFLIYFDQTNDVNKCFFYSTAFDIPPLCEYFLLHGANINTEYESGTTAFHQAVIYNSIGTAELLLSYGANIDKADYELTSLHIAILNNSIEMVELLLSHGANVNEKNKTGETPLLKAVFGNKKEIVELLLSHGANVNESDKYGRTVLCSAAEHNCYEIVKLLISYGANVNQSDKAGCTALYHAAKQNCYEIVELLINSGANINQKNNFGRTALCSAVYHNCKETVKLLLSNGGKLTD